MCIRFFGGGLKLRHLVLCLTLSAVGALLADPVDWTQYERSFTITFPGYTSKTTLSDFPVLIRLSSERNAFKYSKCRAANGGDLRFSDADGNLLSHEIDTWNPDGESLVWVKVPSLSATTEIKAYYGCDNPATVDPKDVWSNGYVGVWHLNESARPLRNSTSTTDIDFTRSHDSAADPGCYDECIAFSTDGAVGAAVGFGTNFGNDSTKDNRGGLLAYDPDGKLSGFDAISIEIWEKVDAFDETYERYMLSKRSDTGDKLSPYYFYMQQPLRPTAVIRLEGGEVADVNCFVAAYEGSMTQSHAGAWNFHCAQYDKTMSAHTNYLNGASAGVRHDASATTGFPVVADAAPLCLGNYTVPYYMNGSKPTVFNGALDELRISSVARSNPWVKATYDTVHNADFTYCDVPNDWTLYSRKFSVKFLMPNNAAGTTLTDFPVLVKVSTNGIPGFLYSDCLKPDGGDLRFSDENGRLLDHEIDTWDTDGESLIWVKVPSLSSNTVITAYYGNIFAPVVDPKTVWSNGYLGVWHLNESARPLRDSTANGIHFTRSNRYNNGNEYDDCATFGQTDSAVGRSVKFNPNVEGKVNKGGLVAPDDAGILLGLDAMTIEIWANHETIDSTTRCMLSRRMCNNTVVDGVTVKYKGYEFATNSKKPTATFYLDNGDGNDNDYCQLKPGTAMSADMAGKWNYHCASYDSHATSHTSYLNAAVAATAVNSTGYAIHSSIPDPLCLANDGQTSSTRVFNGALDELRISNVARSKEWVQATYDTIKNNATFTTYGKVKDLTVKGVRVFVR